MGRQSKLKASARRAAGMATEEISVMKSDLQTYVRDRAEAEARLRNRMSEMESRWGRALAEEEEKLSLLREEIARLKADLNNLLSEKEGLEVALAETETKMRYEEKNNAEMIKEISTLKTEAQNLVREKEEAENNQLNAQVQTESILKEAEKDKAALDDEISRLKRDLQTIKAEEKEKKKGRAAMEEEMSRLNRDSKNMAGEKDDAEVRLQNALAEIVQLKREKAEMEDALDFLKGENQVLEETLRCLVLEENEIKEETLWKEDGEAPRSLDLEVTKETEKISVAERIARSRKEKESMINKATESEEEIKELRALCEEHVSEKEALVEARGLTMELGPLERRELATETEKELIVDEQRTKAVLFRPQASTGDEIGEGEAVQLRRHQRQSWRWKFFSSAVVAAVVLVSIAFTAKSC